MGTKRAGVFEAGESMVLDGTWQEYDLTGANLFILQCRDDDNNINVSHNRAGVPYFTVKAGQSLPLSSFVIDTNTQKDEPERIYVRGAAGAVMEVFKQKRT